MCQRGNRQWEVQTGKGKGTHYDGNASPCHARVVVIGYQIASSDQEKPTERGKKRQPWNWIGLVGLLGPSQVTGKKRGVHEHGRRDLESTSSFPRLGR